jgi:hypothetical protein
MNILAVYNVGKDVDGPAKTLASVLGKTVYEARVRLLACGAGPNAKPARAANFTYVVGELRKRNAQAAFDDRLLTRAGQLQVFGPMLVPEEHQDTAAALLARYHFNVSST